MDNENYNQDNFTREHSKRAFRRGFTKFAQLVAAGLIGSVLTAGILMYAQPQIAGNINSAPSTAALASQGVNSGMVRQLDSTTQADSAITTIAEKVGPSVVGIRVTAVTQDFFYGQQQSTDEGSGIIMRSDGYIMTNYHVVSDAIDTNSKTISQGSEIDVYLPNQKDTPFKASYIGGDSRTDLAVIKINASDLPVAEFGDSDKLKVGEVAVAIGNPGGLEFMGSVTAGIISGLNRTIEGEGNNQMKLIQTDAAINPGNSGGALVNSQGQVIGVNSAKIAATGFEGLGFAIPINTAKQITESLITNKYVPGRPLLGISVDTRYNEQIAKLNNLPAGVLVSDVSILSGAYKAGIKSNDIITKFNGVQIKSYSDLQQQMSQYKPGDIVSLEIYRNGSTKTVQVVLTEDKN